MLYSSQPPHSGTYCTSKQIEIVGLPRSRNRFYYYYFDKEHEKFLPLQCLECQPIIAEGHLKPLYSEWSESLNNYVIHVDNSITERYEQYVFNHRTGGFIEVNVSEFDETKTLPSDDSLICCFPETPDTPEVQIHRSPSNGSILKLRASEKCDELVEILEIYVRTLTTQELENSEMPIQPKGIHRYDRLICTHNPDTVIPFVGFSFKGKPMKFFWNNENRQFERFNCSKCWEVDDTKLVFMYIKLHPRTNQTVFHVLNLVFHHLEQYIFNAETGGLEQIDYDDLPFDQESMDQPMPIILLVTPGIDGSSFVISREGSAIIMHRSDKTGKIERESPIPIKRLTETKDDESSSFIVERKDQSTDTTTLVEHFKTVFVGDQEGSLTILNLLIQMFQHPHPMHRLHKTLPMTADLRQFQPRILREPMQGNTRIDSQIN
uniref:Uncharacterized protein n=1 Tax=Caenorhabditis tropicalis TaxID=1561998 RepID=A0A1I7UYK0_9PELO